MARSYQVACPPGSKALIADLSTLPGGPAVTILNPSTEPLFIGGDENEIVASTGAAVAALSTSTGARIPGGTSLSVRLAGNEMIYGRSGTSTVTITVSIFRTNVAT